ncbi:sulfatase-like hydrolase/transferase [Streptomyces sp. P17]|uniref:sulfatase-like hydrolase/transferase n=1 Tax=Streptomyces sp. P17 TaxID=3074716 RepID=UPI0028F41A07|nr:sulfatase-like hydrolase/transferase [Streptomyces sp. P17]MDT9700487.1 sulfatase-like hydrolase/transferase [Streptomyces sp. P17]
MPSRRRFLTAAAAVPVAATAVTACEEGDKARPAPDGKHASAVPAGQSGSGRLNFVVILADDLGYGELGSYGQKLIRTPRLDALAAEGLRFTDAYATAPVCAPSRCSVLTGLHAGHATVRENPWGPGGQGALTDRDFTFAEALRSLGYRTGVFGKWGFGPEQPDQPSHPNSRGFEEFYGYIDHRHAHDYFPEYLWHNGTRQEIPANRGDAREIYAPDLLKERALAFLDAHRAEPFLLYLTPTLPHAPSQTPDDGEYGDRPWPGPDRRHAAQITTFDSLVGDVVDRLTRLGVAGRTLVLITSDNGPHEEGGTNPDLFDANGPLRGYKRNLYEGGIRVPLIAWSPRHIPAGTTDRPTPLTDLLPTLADLAGAPAPTDVDGLSLAPLLRGSDDPARHNSLYFYRNHSGVTPRSDAVDRGRGRRLAEALRRGDLKAVRFAPGQDRGAPDEEWDVELYDLSRDPGEENDLASARPAQADALVRLMRDSWSPAHPREPFGLTLEVTGQGPEFTLTATLANGSARPWTTPRLTLRAPGGWDIQALDPLTAPVLRAGDELTVRWRITPAQVTSDTTLACRATARHAGEEVTYLARTLLG